MALFHLKPTHCNGESDSHCDHKEKVGGVFFIYKAVTIGTWSRSDDWAFEILPNKNDIKLRGKRMLSLRTWLNKINTGSHNAATYNHTHTHLYY